MNLDHLQTVERARLVSFVGSLDAAQMRRVCRALAVATGIAADTKVEHGSICDACTSLAVSFATQPSAARAQQWSWPGAQISR